jgi:SRSO17 transposase
VDDAAARGLLTRLGTFLDQFAGCFGRRAQRGYASRYIQGLLNDSERKSIEPMHGRLSDPGSYQGLQHFITHSPWETRRFWQRVRALVPIRRGILAIDETSFPKQGHRTVGVKRQYCGALGKVANCVVAVSTAFITGRIAWPTSLELYLPDEWLDDAQRSRARIPPTVHAREKWRIAFAHVRQVLAAGFEIVAVVADSEYSRVARFRSGLERLGLAYVLAVPYFLVARTAPDRPLTMVASIANALPPSAWQIIRWARGSKGPLVARFAAIRVRPAKSRGDRWLICQESFADGERKYYFSNLPAATSLRRLARLARSRWPIEQQYRELKDELGLDHFEVRSYPRWNHHAVLAAITCTFLQRERLRRTPALPTFPEVRNLVREILATLFMLERPSWFNLLVSFQRNPPLRI